MALGNNDVLLKMIIPVFIQHVVNTVQLSQVHLCAAFLELKSIIHPQKTDLNYFYCVSKIRDCKETKISQFILAVLKINS